MRKLWGFLVNHFRNDFHPWHYLTVGLILAVSIVVNYQLRYVDDVLEPMSGIRKFFIYLVFFSIPYFTSILSYCYFHKKFKIFSKKEFWVKGTFAIIALSADSSMSLIYPFISEFSHPLTELWMIKVSVNLLSTFTIMIPIIIFWILIEKHDRTGYGLRPTRFDPKPYFAMLLIMLPFIIGASFNATFERQYPMYKSSMAHSHFGVPEWLTVAGYEFAYGFDFITVEYFFRGFLVVGMISLLGRGAVLSTAVMYCFLHFGKPAGEAVSSVVGGYILGVVAYETRSIWGGVIVHIGLAWMMELVAYLQKISQGT